MVMTHRHDTATPSVSVESEAGISIEALQAAHVARQEEWCPDQKPDLSFRGNEMAGEVGEACNVIKKLERERQGWRGSRATVDDLGDELADVIHTAILCGITAGEAVEPEGPFIVMSSNYARPFLLGCYETLEQAAKAQCGSPEKWDIFIRHPAPEDTARLREDLERESKESYEIGKRDGYEEAVQHIDERTGGDGEYCCVVGYDADDKHCPDPQSMIARIVGRFETLSEQANVANRERDDARKALETARNGWRNGCERTVPEALRFLANNDRPIGGEQRFNAWHLFQLADEIEFAARSASREANHGTRSS